jgi:hypothetical protein
LVIQIAPRSTGARAKRLACRKRTRPHAEARTERRRHVAEKVTTRRATPFDAHRVGGVGAQPMASGFAKRVDALHGQAGQVLHSFTSEAAKPSQSYVGHPLTATHTRIGGVPWRPCCSPRSPEEEGLARSSAAGQRQGARGNRSLDGGHSALSHLWCQEENTTRYCGKVARVKIVVCAPRKISRTRSRKDSRALKYAVVQWVRKSVSVFCVLRMKLLRLNGCVDEPQDGGRNAKSTKV